MVTERISVKRICGMLPPNDGLWLWRTTIFMVVASGAAGFAICGLLITILGAL